MAGQIPLPRCFSLAELPWRFPFLGTWPLDSHCCFPRSTELVCCFQERLTCWLVLVNYARLNFNIAICLGLESPNVCSSFFTPRTWCPLLVTVRFLTPSTIVWYCVIYIYIYHKPSSYVGYFNQRSDVARSLGHVCILTRQAYSIAFHPSGFHLIIGQSDKLRLMNLLMEALLGHGWAKHG